MGESAYFKPFTCFNCNKLIRRDCVGRMQCSMHIQPHNGCVSGKNYGISAFECCGLTILPTDKLYYRRDGVQGCIKSDHAKNEDERDYIRNIPFVIIPLNLYPVYMPRVFELKSWTDLDFIIQYKDTSSSTVKNVNLRDLYLKTFKQDVRDVYLDETNIFDPLAEVSQLINFTESCVIQRRDIYGLSIVPIF